MSGRGVIPLFWRLFIPNACVLVAACVVLIVEPANGRVLALVGGMAIMLGSRLSQQTGLPIDRVLPPASPDLTPEEELAVYRIAQESLTNVVRHAGAGEARLTLHCDDEYVELTVADDGVGMPETGVRMDGGVRGMRERAVLIGGEISWARSDAGGTVVRLRVPATAA